MRSQERSAQGSSVSDISSNSSPRTAARPSRDLQRQRGEVAVRSEHGQGGQAEDEGPGLVAGPPCHDVRANQRAVRSKHEQAAQCSP